MSHMFMSRVWQVRSRCSTATRVISRCSTATRCISRCSTATRCITLNHAATIVNIFAIHCSTLKHNTLQHTATHCNTLQHTATHCNTQCNTLSHPGGHTRRRKRNSRNDGRHSTYCHCSRYVVCVWRKLKVSFVKQPYKRDHILQKRPIILRSILIVATPYLE